MYTPKEGDAVLFGRSNGEKTRGTVIKVNRTKAKIRQDEARGQQKAHKVGTEWNVPFSMLELVKTKGNGMTDTHKKNLAVNTLKLVQTFLEKEHTDLPGKIYEQVVAAIKECD